MSINDEQKEARAALGLPTDRPIVMSGHQAGFWHPGILAKQLAIDALARRTGACAAWIVIDTSFSSGLRIEWPRRGPNGLVREVFEPGRNWLLKSLPSHASLKFPRTNPPPGIDDVERELANALPTAATEDAQVAIANTELLRGRLGTPPPKLLYASELSRLDAFDSLVNRMISDPLACFLAYNDAAERYPKARVSSLDATYSCSEILAHAEERNISFEKAWHLIRRKLVRFELPLWRSLGPSQGGLRVWSDKISNMPKNLLAPRALMTTAVLRSAACDLFVHGTGGALYDKVTEGWISDWLGTTMPLAPTAMATATLRLGPSTLGDVTLVSDSEFQNAAWRAHTARYRPGLVGDDEAERKREDLVRAIQAAPRRSPERQRLFHALHTFESEHRRVNADRLEALDREIDGLRALKHDSDIASDRTWSWWLHADTDLAELKGRIDAVFGV